MEQLQNIVKCLTIVCLNTFNIPLALQGYAKPHDPLKFWIISDQFENLFISQQCGCDDNY